MRKLMIIGIAVIAAITMTTGSAYSDDYSRYSTDELSHMRGPMQNATEEERESFRHEWQERTRNMTQEERQEYMGKKSDKDMKSGEGMMKKYNDTWSDDDSGEYGRRRGNYDDDSSEYKNRKWNDDDSDAYGGRKRIQEESEYGAGNGYEKGYGRGMGSGKK